MSKRHRRKIPTETRTADVSHMNHEGRGIAHIDGKTTFIFGALPNETVNFKYTNCHAQFDEGAVVEVMTAAPERVTPRCQHFGVCGGCSLQHLSAESQRLHKQKSVLEHFQHQAHCQPTEVLPPLYADTFGYRRRARLSVKYVLKKNAVLVGFRERNSNFVADIQQCETLHPSIGKKIKIISELLMQLEMKSQIPQLEISIGDNATAIIVRHLVALPQSDIDKLIAFAKDNQLHLYFQPKNYDSIHPVYPEKPEVLFYEIPANNLKITFQPAQFTQINQELNLQMIARAIDLLDLKKSDVVLDLFCGIGNFSLPIALHCAHVVGVEGADHAIAQAKKNAVINHLSNAEFYVHDLAADLQQVAWSTRQYDKILLDPPRAGAQELMRYMTSWKPSRIVYISCNPITLARDAEYLLQLGYRLEKVGVMDMFPHTEHVEAIALFMRDSDDKRSPHLPRIQTLDRAS